MCEYKRTEGFGTGMVAWPAARRPSQLTLVVCPPQAAVGEVFTAAISLGVWSSAALIRASPWPQRRGPAVANMAVADRSQPMTTDVYFGLLSYLRLQTILLSCFGLCILTGVHRICAGISPVDRLVSFLGKTYIIPDGPC